MPNKSQQLYSRPSWERMMHIHERIRNGKYPNCTSLAREIQVSVRTLMRDVVFMKDRLNLPIEYDSVHNGYYYSEAVDRFPSVAITEAEMFGLLVAHKAIAQYQGTSFQKPLETAYRKITENLGAQRARLRHANPYHLACIENHWYLFAFDKERQAIRIFVLTRMSRLALADDRFEIPKTFHIDEYDRVNHCKSTRLGQSAAESV